ncbi:hypothetical protein [Streptomyces sp. NPDC059863]|uniref:hypothetical protein n=1 Tax=unclassified Streptomyces TaxID=2593676 RepID=UPI0036548344
MRALPSHPRIALVHGTDLLFAEAHRDQLQILRETARAADAIVVPTGAMADQLLRLAPQTDRRKVTHIPWGIPDQLLTSPPIRLPRTSMSHLRLLYAGRLTAEKWGGGPGQEPGPDPRRRAVHRRPPEPSSMPWPRC